MEPMLTRRAFTQGAVQSLMTFSLLDLLSDNQAFANKIRPITGHWLSEMDELGRQVRERELKQVLWQKKVEELFSRVNLPDLLKLIDFEALEKKAKGYDGPGPRRLSVRFPEIAGVPTKFVPTPPPKFAVL